MDEAVIKYYKKLIKDGFVYIGEIEKPSILLDSVAEGTTLCGQAAGNSLHLYVKISNDLIEKIRYLCTCDPTVNVVIEILCSLVEGKRITDAKTLTLGAFSVALGTSDEEFLEKARLATEFLNKGIKRFELETH
jgi:NifU-like protein involved in Fe-S cluster formation